MKDLITFENLAAFIGLTLFVTLCFFMIGYAVSVPIWWNVL